MCIRDRSREIIDEALKIAETKKREALLEAKEESLKTKNELEKETKERRAELQRYERRVLSKEENLDKKAEAMEKREAGMNVKEEALKRKTAEAEALYEKGMLELEKISGLTSEQAKDCLLYTSSELEREKFRYLHPNSSGGQAGRICTALAPL